MRHGGVSSPAGAAAAATRRCAPTLARSSWSIIASRNSVAERRASGDSPLRTRTKRADCRRASSRASAAPLGLVIEKPLAPVVRALARLDETAVEQLLEDAVEALLGDLENVEQRRDGEAWTPVDEMQHPVVRAAEFIFLQQTVRVLHEVSIGEKKQLHHVENRVVALRREIRAGGSPPERKALAEAEFTGDASFTRGLAPSASAPSRREAPAKWRSNGDQAVTTGGRAGYVSYIDIFSSDS